MTFREYLNLKEEVEQLQKKVGQYDGALQALYAQAKKEFGCSTLKEMVDLLLFMDKDIERREKRLQEERQEYEKRYGEKLK